MPFISYGGSSMVVAMVGVGILLNISRQTVEPRRITTAADHTVDDTDAMASRQREMARPVHEGVKTFGRASRQGGGNQC
jgi:hypothetical protein